MEFPFPPVLDKLRVSSVSKGYQDHEILSSLCDNS